MLTRFTYFRYRLTLIIIRISVLLMANKIPEISVYVDDIPMKLSDKYKPIDLSAYLDHEIIFPDINELLNDFSLNYNFDRELYSLEVAKRRDLAKQKQNSEIVDSKSKFDKQLIGDKQLEKSALKKTLSNNLNVSSKKLIELNYGEILKPLTNRGANMSDIYISDTNIVSRQKGNKSAINPKEFENDTSSPFDNVELQTIDDMQELNSVFSAFHKHHINDINNETTNNGQIHHNSNQFNNINGIHLSGVYGYQIPNTLDDNSVKMNYSHIDNENAAQYQSSSLRSSKSASDLPTLLNIEESLCKKERSHTPPCYSSNKKLNKTKQKLILSDPYDELSQYSKDFVNSISLMGFERSRVARAVKHIQNDHKKVIDFLLQVQALEEDGYDCSEAEIALHMNSYQFLKAKKFLDSLWHLSEAGFNKADIVKALVKCNNDRDKALDILLNSE